MLLFDHCDQWHRYHTEVKPVQTRTVEAGVAEHAALVDDMLPVARGAERTQLVKQLLAHQLNAVRHQLHMLHPETSVVLVIGM